MQKRQIVDVIIPAWNEEKSLPFVLDALPSEIVRNVVIGNNGSTDRTAEVARAHGAIVVDEPQRGYGNACLAAMRHIREEWKDQLPDIVVFLDADFSDDPSQLGEVIQPIVDGKADLVIGSRMLGQRAKDSMTIPQQFGNWLAPALIKLFWGMKFTDLGPFRAIKWSILEAMQMEDRNFGWTVEMQIKAAKMNITGVEVPVRYKKRIAGKSKVSGTIKGAFMAGSIILLCVFKHLFSNPPEIDVSKPVKK